jgi:REP element-mobilizing transposase RayT
VGESSLTVGLLAFGQLGILRLMFNRPLGYFITFRTYGTWLHGDERGSVDRKQNEFGTPTVPTSEYREEWERSELKHAPVELDSGQREVVERTIREVCSHKAWKLMAVNVRTNHVHVVVDAPGAPEPVLNAFKAWATRRLAEAGLVERGARVWSRHGSTVYLFKEDKVEEKCRYVRDCQ